MPYVIAAALGFASAYILVAIVLFPGRGADNDVKVPSVTGLTQDEARRRLERVGLRAKEGATRMSGAAPRGTVVAQEPLPETTQPAGTTVVLTVSGGQRLEGVPDVGGMARREAERALETAGFAVGGVTQRASESPRGTVIQTSPAAGEQAALPGPIALVLSSGPATVVIPDVAGRSYASARQMLEQIGLAVTGLGLDSLSTAAAGTVVQQNPSAGRSVPSGSTIGLRLSAGIGAVPPAGGIGTVPPPAR